MNDVELNPYETPKSPRLRRRYSYLTYTSIIAILLLFGASAAIMFLRVEEKSSDKIMDRRFLNRGPAPRFEPPTVPASNSVQP